MSMNRSAPTIRKHHSSASPYEKSIGFCRALRTGNRVLVSGTAPIGPDGLTVDGGADLQARRCFDIIAEALIALGAGVDEVVRTRTYLVDRRDWQAVARIHGELFHRARPAATMVVVPSLLDAAWRVEIEVEAQVGSAQTSPSAIRVAPADDDDRRWIDENTQALFNGEVVISRARTHRPARLPAVIAWEASERVGLATWQIEREDCELVTIDALRRWQGIGTALLAQVEASARQAGCRKLWLVTTNDNVDAVRFYQRRGFRLAAIHTDAMARSRALKPTIPWVGMHGIPIRDELELSKPL